MKRFAVIGGILGFLSLAGYALAQWDGYTTYAPPYQPGSTVVNTPPAQTVVNQPAVQTVVNQPTQPVAPPMVPVPPMPGPTVVPPATVPPSALPTREWHDGMRESFTHTDVHEIRPIKPWENQPVYYQYPQQYQYYPQYQQQYYQYPQYQYYPQQQWCYPQQTQCQYYYPRQQQYYCYPQYQYRQPCFLDWFRCW